MLIIGPILIAFGILISVLGWPSTSTTDPKVGDIYAQTNPGFSDSPDKKPNPFVAIYEIKEIRDRKFRVVIHYLESDGHSFGAEQWKSDVMFDEKLSRCKP